MTEEDSPDVIGEGLRSPRGTHDVLPPESSRWEELITRFATLAERHGYGLAHTPTIEDARVFRRGIGEASEVVGKEMYEFDDRSGRHLALRPEGTAPIVRAFVQHRPPVPWRVWYVTPAFRYEQPQAGRYRQHHQLGVEVLGTEDPDLDVEVIALAHDFYRDLGLSSFSLRVNSLGDTTCRPQYLEDLAAYLEGVSGELCDEHRETWRRNPLRVLDCKKEACREATKDAPLLRHQLCEPCEAHLARVLAGLDAAGVGWTADDRLVRGLDYYTRTTFEFTGTALESAIDAISGGGRYDLLAEALGGPPTPGIGFGGGIERLLQACDADGVLPVVEKVPEVFVVDVTGGAAARDLVLALRRAGVRAERAYDGRSMKAQLKVADRSGAALALIIGPSELASGTVVVRDLRAGTQLTEPLAALLVRAEGGQQLGGTP
ncbi:MAG TPA: histidine--tRNA ligase [Acidimicrobiales bacterium]|nr:histidine--tRNA ligase [Acidimicrobiales bacterium]